MKTLSQEEMIEFLDEIKEHFYEIMEESMGDFCREEAACGYNKCQMLIDDMLGNNLS